MAFQFRITTIKLSMHSQLTRVIDFFYPPFKRWLPLDLFRYMSCGGANVLFDWVLYFCFYNFIFDKTNVDLGLLVFKPHIAALVFTFPISLLSGFYLSSKITFKGSALHGRVQLFRYLVIVAVNLAINYFCLKIMVDIMDIYPTPAKMITTVFTTLFSYFAQKHYSFKS